MGYVYVRMEYRVVSSLGILPRAPDGPGGPVSGGGYWFPHHGEGICDITIHTAKSFRGKFYLVHLKNMLKKWTECNVQIWFSYIQFGRVWYIYMLCSLTW